MGVLSFIRSTHFFDFLTFGRSNIRIFAIVAGETIFLGASFFAATPPFLPVLVGHQVALPIIAILAAALPILFVLLSGLGYRTYSVTFHKPLHILKCWAAYLFFSTVVTFAGYFLLVYPYAGNLIPKPVDVGIGAVLSVAYAISVASIIYGEDLFSNSSNSKSQEISAFCSVANGLREKPKSKVVDEPDRLIQAGESILTGLQTSDLEGTSDLASDLQDWIETFKQRELHGQKKMVGDLPDSRSRFAIWEERYEAFRDIRKELEQMDSSAIHRLLLSIRDE